MQKTIYDDAEELGEMRGEKRSEKRGEERAGRRLLLFQLEAKFGALPERARKKVERLQPDQFDDFAAARDGERPE